MEKSLDELMGFLLDEIAVSGPQGVTVSQIKGFVKSFYAVDREHQPSDEDQNVEDRRADVVQSVDDDFLSSVWQWLGRHPDVSIGKDKKYNRVSLAEIESRAHASGGESKRKVADAPRIHVTEDRTYRAICGHAPDPTKVFATELALLSHIAAARSDGVLQGDLVRLSGQDKRSVPARTDALQTKGYITKERVYVRGTRTSRLTLQRYVGKDGANLGEGGHTKHDEQAETVRNVLLAILKILSEERLLSIKELATRSGMETPVLTRIVAKIVRQLERMDCVKRVKMAFGPAAKSGDLKHCVQLLRHPTEQDMAIFDKNNLRLDHPISQVVAELTAETENLIMDPDSVAKIDEITFIEPSDSAPMAQWSPDRMMPNMLLDAAHVAGLNGLTNALAKNMITGPFVRKPIESLLGRLSNKRLEPQPANLQRLAIVRTGGNSDSPAGHLHYSLPAFRQAINAGLIDGSAIPGGLGVVGMVQDKGTTRVVKFADVETDEFGFPISAPPEYQFRDGEASFAELNRTAQAASIYPRGGEPKLDRNDAGEEVLGTHTGVSPDPETRPVKRKRLHRDLNDDDDSDHKIRGRPRKFLRGTEKFWQYQFMNAKVQATDGEVNRAEKAGVMNDPAGLALFRQRPQNFDETLVAAKEAGLPLPAMPEDITDDWVRKTELVLSRSGTGVYITPLGTYLGRLKYRSQLLIVRSDRISKLDFVNRAKVSKFRFISSSASHSFHFRRFYPQLRQKLPKQARALERKLPPVMRASDRTELRPARVRKRNQGPKLGLFFEDDESGKKESIEVDQPQPLTVNEYWECMDSTDTDSEVERLHQMSARKDMSPHSGRTLRSSSPETSSPAQIITTHEKDKLEELSTTSNIDRHVRPTRWKKPTQKAAEMRESSADSFSSLRTRSSTRSQTNTPILLDLATEHIKASELRFPSSEASEAVRTTRSSNNVRDSTQSLPPVCEPAPEAVLEMPAMATLATPISTNEPSERTAVGYLLALNETLPVQIKVIQAQQTDHVRGRSLPGPKSVVETTHDPPLTISRKRAFSVSDFSADESIGELDTKRHKPNLGRADRNSLCRRIVVELVLLASGAAPNNTSTIRRIMTNRWQAAGRADDRPLLNALKTVIKRLCETGKLKTIMFTFRGKGGAMQKRSILALPGIDGACSQIQELKEKIIIADTTEYVPPEWEAEARQTAGTILRRQIVEESPKARPVRRATRKQSENTSSSQDPEVQSFATFLTLKCSRLGELPQVHAFNAQLKEPMWRSYRPAVESHSDTFATSLSKSTRRRRGRSGGPKNMRFDSKTHRIIWGQRREIDPPRMSLRIILDAEYAKDGSVRPAADLPEGDRFAAEVDAVAAWEERYVETSQPKSTKWEFINHTTTAYSPFDPIISFEFIVGFDENENEIETEYPPDESWPPFVSALESTEMQETALAEFISPQKSIHSGSRRITRQSTGSLRKRKWQPSFEDADFEPLVKKTRRARGRRQSTTSTEVSTTIDEAPTPSQNETAPKKRTRKPNLRTLSEEMKFRIAVAVVCVRTLGGGLDSSIDWSIVARLFPDDEESVVKQRWKSIENGYRRDVENLTENLQRQYIEALQDDAAPTVNFDDLASSDWNGIINWALENLDPTSVKQLEELPTTREQFISSNNFTFKEFEGLRSMLGYHVNSTQAQKEEAVGGIVFGTRIYLTPPASPLQHTHATETELRSPAFGLARSFVLASILTPETTFNAQHTRSKLLSIAPTVDECETLITKAVSSLQRDKLIVRKRHPNNADYATPNDARDMRVYDASAKFFEIFLLRRMIHRTMLTNATQFKLHTLDAAFRRGETVRVRKDAVVEDGEMVAILNLLSQGMLRMRPGADVPQSRYGIDHKNVGYQTKMVGKEHFAFEVDIEATSRYVLGDVAAIERRLPVPKGGVDESGRRIPAWFDINGALQPGLWEMFLAAVVGLVSIRPGVDARELSRNLTFALTEWEVELLLGWAETASFVKRTKMMQGWETREWWWLCVGLGVEGGWLWSDGS